MPRKARIDAPGALHHVIFRGIERRKIFRDNKDRWACRELGMKTIELAETLNMSQPSVSQSVRRGEILCKNRGCRLVE